VLSQEEPELLHFEIVTDVQYFVRKGVIIMLHFILWGILILVLLIWLFGFLFKLAGGIIRILIAIAAIIIILNVLSYLFHWF
jgi:hypothetical protein